MNIDDLLKGMVEYLLNNGILIGSRRWGGEKPNSDWDVVFNRSTFFELMQRLHKYEDKHIKLTFNRNYSDNKMYNIENVKIKFNDEKYIKEEINILVYRDEELPLIDELNHYMDEIRDTQLGLLMKLDKEIRIKVVEIFLDELFREKIIVDDSDTDIPF
jgi:predicted nucleotidyltransferase